MADHENPLVPELVDAPPETRAIVRRQPKDVPLVPVMDLSFAKQRMTELQHFCADYLQESKDGGTDGGDYGIIPGAGKKKVLLKSGADKLCDVYGLADRYRIIRAVEDFDHGLFDYTIQCELYRKTDEMFVGSGLGSCSSYESKYRWRESQRSCPKCAKNAIIKGREEYGGGWVCFKKKDGCGAKFSDTDPAITSQVVGRAENPDIVDTKNTVLKMAKKRAKIDAVIGATRSSGIFTQDLIEAAEEEETGAVISTRGEVPDEQKTTRTRREAPSMPPPTTSLAPPPPERPAPQSDTKPAEKPAVPGKCPECKASGIHHRPGCSMGSAPAPNTDAPAPAHAPAAPPAAAKATPPATPELPAPPEGKVYVTAMNVRNGPMVMKTVDGEVKNVPSWGPLYVIVFSHKVKATDGTLVTEATTFDEKLALEAANLRDIYEDAKKSGDYTQAAVSAVVKPGRKKSTFDLVKFE